MTSETGFDGELILAPAQNEGAPEGARLLQAKAAVYPGSQQVSLWLPADGWSGYQTLRILGPSAAMIAERRAAAPIGPNSSSAIRCQPV